MNNKLKLIELSCLLGPLMVFLISAGAQAKPSLPAVRLTGIQNGQTVNLDWKNKIVPRWETNAEGGLEFYWVVTVAVPNPAEISNIQTDQALVGFTNKKSGTPGKNTAENKAGEAGIPFKMTSLKHSFIVEYNNGGSVQFMVELLIPEPLQMDDQCEKNLLKVVSAAPAGTPAKASSLPGYLVYKCEKTERGILLAVTVPNETSWVSSSIFETKGKGQRWKNFELNPQAPAGNKDAIGEFTFEHKGKRYNYSVVTEKVEPKGKIARFRLSLGLTNISIATSTEKVAATKPAAHVSFEVRPFYPEFSIGGNGLTTIPLNSNSFFSHSESIGYFGWTFGHRTTLSFEPRIYIYMTEGISQQINYFYKLNSPAFGGAVRYLLADNKALEGELLFMQQAQTSITSFRLYFNKNNPTVIANPNSPNWGNWGIAAIFQKVDVASSASTKDSTSQIYLGPSLDF